MWRSALVAIYVALLSLFAPEWIGRHTFDEPADEPAKTTCGVLGDVLDPPG